MRNAAGAFLGTQGWSPAKIGGLGYVTGLVISADGTLMVCRTDVGGAYRRESTTGVWTQLFTTDHMTLPDPLTVLGGRQGCFAVTIAPSDPSHVYAAFRSRMWRSVDRGVTLVDDGLNGTTGLYMNPNGGNQRLRQHKLEVDPSNPDVVHFGSQLNSLWMRLSNAWSQIASVPAASIGNDNDKAVLIAVDKTSSLTGSGATSRRSIVYVSSSGNGIYKSTDGGLTYSSIATAVTFPALGTASCTTTNALAVVTTASTTGLAVQQAITGTGIPAGAFILTVDSATQFTMSANATASATNTLSFYAAFKALHLMCDAAGLLWFARDNGSGTNVWTYNGSWTNNTVLGVSQRVWSIEQDPKDATRYLGIVAGGNPWRTLDSGVTQKFWQPGAQRAVAGNVPIIAAVLNSTFVASQSAAATTIVPHPVLNKDYAAMGLGVCNFDSPWPTLSTTTIYWNEDSAGIETLVANDILITPDGDVICSSQDKALIRLNGSSYPASSFPASALDTGFGADYAIDNYQWLYGLVNNQAGGRQSAKSLDGGRTWTLTAQPSTRLGGCVAVGNAGNVVVFPGQNGYPKYTTDSGLTWNACPFTGWTMPAEGTENGWGFGASNTRRHIVVADKANPGTFYAYNYKDLSGNSMGLWKSTDNGATFARVNTTSIINPLFAGFHAQLRMDRGILYLCPGESGDSYNGDVANITYRSEDGGINWTALGELYEINLLAIGAPLTATSYHTLYALGWKTIGGVPTFGLYRSMNKGAQWTLLNNNPTFDHAYAMAADPRISRFGRVIVGYSGTGYTESTYSYNLLLKAS